MRTSIEPFYDERTHTLTYVVYDAATRDAVIINPVLDYDPVGSRVWTESVDRATAFIRGHELRLHYILETHAHADHLSGSQAVKRAFPEARLAVGERIVEVQRIFKRVFDLPADFPTDGRQFDRLLYDSVVGRLYGLPDETRVFVGHDYMPGGRAVAWEAPLAEHKAHNVQIPVGRAKADFVAFRQARDATLSAPQLLFQSVQVNVDGGTLPRPAANETRYLKIPINVFRPEPAGSVGLSDV